MVWAMCVLAFKREVGRKHMGTWVYEIVAFGCLNVFPQAFPQAPCRWWKRSFGQLCWTLACRPAWFCFKMFQVPVTYSLSSMLRRACDGDVSTHIFRSFSRQMAPKQIAPKKRPVQPAAKRPAPKPRPVQPAPVEPGIDKRPAEPLDLWAQHGLNKPPPPVEVTHAPLLN